LAAALRTNMTLTALVLTDVGLWRDAAAATALMGALTAHPRLRLLDLSRNNAHIFEHGAWVGAALAALVRANAPALQTLRMYDCLLGDAAMGPVVEALRHNTHLTKLNCSGNTLRPYFARNRLLPAVRVNTSLRELVAADEGFPDHALREAEALVAARARTQPV
jgi:Ran GTPase-activating protein (RanGAP) involved in mRNA processing and transport